MGLTRFFSAFSAVFDKSYAIFRPHFQHVGLTSTARGTYNFQRTFSVCTGSCIEHTTCSSQMPQGKDDGDVYHFPFIIASSQIRARPN